MCVMLHYSLSRLNFVFVFVYYVLSLFLAVSLSCLELHNYQHEPATVIKCTLTTLYCLRYNNITIRIWLYRCSLALQLKNCVWSPVITIATRVIHISPRNSTLSSYSRESNNFCFSSTTIFPTTPHYARERFASVSSSLKMFCLFCLWFF